MDKKALLILGVWLLAYLGYNVFIYGPEQQRRAQAAAAARAAATSSATVAAPRTSSAPTPGTQAPSPQPEVAAAPRVTVDFRTPEHVIKLSSAGASLEDLTFSGVMGSRYKPVQTGAEDGRERQPYHALHPYHPEVRSLALLPTGLGEDLGWVTTRDWSHEALPGGAHRFWIDLPQGLRLSKEFHPPTPLEGEGEDARAFHFDLRVRLENRAGEPRTLGYELWSPVGILNQDAGRGAYGTQVLLAAREGRSVSLTTEVATELQDPAEDAIKVDTQSGEGWISYYGIGTHYFAAVVIPDREGHPVRAAEADSPLRRLRRAPSREEQKEDGLAHQAFARGAVPHRTLAPNQAVEDRYLVYVGPRQKRPFERAGSPYAGLGLEHTVDFGWFEFLARLLLWLLFGLHALLGNWGVAIIALTFIVRGLILPVSIWGQKNMLRMQRIAPEINALKEKFTRKDGTMTPDQQRAFSAAQMDLFRKHGVNPIGCVGPIFLQIPVFVGLYNALNSSFELRQTPFFLWMDDLSVPEVVARLPFSLPLLGTNAVSILPLIMVGVYLLQHAMSPVPSDPRAAEQHRIMRFMFPLFGLLMYTMPSGLMIYFITSSLWSIGEMKTVKRWIEQAEALAQAQKAGEGAGPGSQFPGLAPR